LLDCDFARRNAAQLAIDEDPGEHGLKFQQIANGALRFGGCLVADEIAQADHPDHKRAGEELGARESDKDCQAVEQIDIQPALIAEHRKSTMPDWQSSENEQW